MPTIGKPLGYTQVQTTARYAHLARDTLGLHLRAMPDRPTGAPAEGQRLFTAHWISQLRVVTAGQARWTVTLLLAMSEYTDARDELLGRAVESDLRGL